MVINVQQTVQKLSEAVQIKSASLSCSFGLFDLSGLFGCI